MVYDINILISFDWPNAFKNLNYFMKGIYFEVFSFLNKTKLFIFKIIKVPT